MPVICCAVPQSAVLDSDNFIQTGGTILEVFSIDIVKWTFT